MPSLISHYILSDALSGDLPLTLRRDAYILGGFGPDFFLFHRAAPWQPGKRLNKISSKLHRGNPADALSLMREYTENAPDRDFALSYILGYLTHYALDRTAHPYIYWAQERIIKAENIKYNPFFVHCRIENNLDLILLRETGSTPKIKNPAELIPEKAETLDAAARLMFFVTERLFPGETDERLVRQAFTHLRSNLKILGSGGAGRAVLGILQSIAPRRIPAVQEMIYPKIPDTRFDYANNRKMPWQNPFAPGNIRNESFFELFTYAKDDARALITGFLDNHDLDRLTEKRTFRSGVENSTTLA